MEMLTIKKMLKRRKECVVLDKHLCWDNARLSEYQSDFQHYFDFEVYGIELLEDISLPNNYVRIDHHNDGNDKPSALEQVASLLGVTLNHDQLLIAANDKGYISAMLALGATEGEIADIRRRDRAAQGVTEQDEALAEQSLAQNLSQFGRLIVVKSQTPRFSTICDKLFPYQSLLIYTDTEWMFYGAGKAELVKDLSGCIEHKKIFHGGDDCGYIGTVRHAYSKEQIERFVKQIIKDYGHI